MHFARPEIREARFDLLPYVDAIHEIVPGRGRREATNELDGFGLNAAALCFRARHAAKFGPADGIGKRLFGWQPVLQAQRGRGERSRRQPGSRRCTPGRPTASR